VTRRLGEVSDIALRDAKVTIAVVCRGNEQEDAVSDEPEGMTAIDAVAFVTLSEGLRDAFARLGSHELTEDQRGRWQRRLLAITNAAQRDLPRAQAQLDRYDADWTREVG